MGDYKHRIINKLFPGIGTIRGSGGTGLRNEFPPLHGQQLSERCPHE